MANVGLLASLALLAACATNQAAAPKPSAPPESDEPTPTVSEPMTTEPTTTEPASVPSGYQYSERGKAEFLAGCVEESDAAMCDCLLVQVQLRYPEEFLDANGLEGLSADEIDEIVAPCR